MTHITILGQQVKIYRCTKDELDGALDNSGSDTCYGYYDEMARQIWILDTLDGPTYQRVLIHECVHAYLRIAGYHELMPHETEEGVCTVLENIHELFNNPQFLNEVKKYEYEITETYRGPSQ